jgi:Carboxypeptidase regulatory-like domain
MLRKRVVLLCGALFCFFALTPSSLYSQSATTGAVGGEVTDPTGAIVPGATVTLLPVGANVTQTTTTDSAGRYLFPAVNPGTYNVKCLGRGFRSVVVNQVDVLVLKTTTVDIRLEVGQQSEVVEVVASTGAELQTSDASIGTVIAGDTLQRLPAQQRSITALMMLQPAVSPSAGADDVNGGMVSGALADQSTFFVDGGDATSDLEGTNSYVSPPGEPQPAPFIAVPAETVQEFRVVTANPTASFSRSQGGEVAVLTKAGTNTLHGSAYEYYYGDATSGNTWLFNRLGKHKPHSVNNRYGGTFGGPIWKNKLFAFGNYEGRRFYQNATITQLVPTDPVRAGILRFKDSTGATVQYSLAPGSVSNMCGAAGTSSCDPRGIGISPLISNYLKLLPEPNNFTAGDGLNSAGYTASFAQPVIEDLAVARLDYNINSKWSVFGTFHYNRYNLATTQQFDITCATPNCTTGADKLISKTPVQPRFVTFMLQGAVTSHFTSQTHGSYMHDWWNWNRAPVVPQIPGASGTGATLNLSGEARIAGTGSGSKVWGDPVNYDTQNGRARVWGGKDWFISQDSAWIHGSHSFTFGGSYYYWFLTHLRTDIVTGGLTGGPIYYVGQTTHNGGSFLSIPSAEAPPRCSATITADCLTSSSQFNRWSNMYATLLGLLDRSSQIGTRNGDFVANQLGQPLIDHVHTHTFETYFQDSWKIKPSITLTYGLTYGVQFAPTEQDGKQVLQVWAANNQPLQNMLAFYQQRNAALSSGGFFASGTIANGGLLDQTFGFSPIRHIPGRSTSSRTDYRDFGPRVAVAWSVPYHNRVFGNKQTVIRAGYSILWNRTNGVGEALTPLLGDGLASALTCNGPTFVGAAGGTAACSGSSINATNGYRLGVDGNTVPIPPLANAPIPLVPGAPFNLSRASLQDPNIRLPYSHNISVDVQRAFAHNWLIDVGYLGRIYKNLWHNVDINAVDPYAKTPACTAGQAGCTVPTSGQTLAQAYNALFNGSTSPQPFFENAPYGGPGNTAKINGLDGGDPSLATFFLFNYEACMVPGNCSTQILGQPLDPMQAVVDNMTTDGARAYYHALFVSARKSMGQGLDVNFNYTWSHSYGSGGSNFLGQQYTFYSDPTPFDYSSGFGSNNGDRRHVINASWYYLLPFGKGRRYATSNGLLNRVAGGWYVSGIWTWATGRPVCIGADGDYGTPDGFTCAIGTFFGQASRHNNVTGSNGIGTNGNINLFANPAAAYNSLGTPLPGVDGRPNAENLNEPRTWNLDLSVGKNILSTERYKVLFSADFFNVFNHPLLGTNATAGSVSLDLADPKGFGVINGADNTPRVIQIGLRFEF